MERTKTEAKGLRAMDAAGADAGWVWQLEPKAVKLKSIPLGELGVAVQKVSQGDQSSMQKKSKVAVRKVSAETQEYELVNRSEGRQRRGHGGVELCSKCGEW